MDKMVQLNTTYDKTLKQKIFVLKGEEAYARTTDVLVDLISDFDDCNTHINYARVGLEVDVLREISLGFIYIYDDDNLIYESIPWDAENMATIIDSDWNSKGVYWIDNRLVIGTESNTDSGLLLAYDIPHNIKVKFSGNKQCLGSVSETVSFEMETPDSYSSVLNVTSSQTSYHTGTTASFTLNLATSGDTLDKTIKVYLDGDENPIDTLTGKSANTDFTYTKTGLTDGLHSFRFVFGGDDESLFAENSVDISVGYQVLLTDYPSVAVNGNGYSVTCRVIDYFNTPVVDGMVTGVYYVPNWGWEQLSQPFYTNSDGYATITPFYFNNYDIYVNYKGSDGTNDHDYYSEVLPTSVVTADAITLTVDNPIIGANQNRYASVKAYLTSNSSRVAQEGIPITHTINWGGTTTTTTINTMDNGIAHSGMWGRGRGDIYITATNSNLTSSTIHIEDVCQYWNINGNSLNKSIIRSNGLSETSSGYKLTATSGKAYIRLSFNYEQTFPDVSGFSVEYEIVSVNGTVYPTVMGSAKYYQLYQGDVVRFEYIPNGQSKLYINDVLKSQGNISSSKEYMEFGIKQSNSDPGYIVFNNLKYKVLW